MPKGRRDEWLDRGAKSDEANEILAEARKKSKGSKDRVETKQSATTSRIGGADNPPVPDEPDEESGEPAPFEGDDGENGEQSYPLPMVHEEEPAAISQSGEPPQPAVANEQSEPLSEAEREVVECALRSYKNGRSLLRTKILAGLAAYPDAVAFFRKMIRSGS